MTRPIALAPVLVLAIVVGLAVGVVAQTPAPPTEIKPTEELHTLKVQNLQMRTQLLQQQVAELQRQVQEAGAKLDADWKELEATLRAALKVPTEYTFDKQRGLFAPPSDKKPPTP